MTLWARNNDGGNCSSTASVKIDTIVRCCRRDKTSSVDLFNVGGTQYRMKSKFRCWRGPRSPVREDEAASAQERDLVAGKRGLDCG